MPTIIEPTSQEHWLNLRTEDITSTEIAALFGQSPYQTEFEVFHHKKNRTYGQVDDNERMKWGRRLQDVIAFGIAQDMGWGIKPITAYMRHSTQRGMGSSFDYEVLFEDGVIGIMEVKAVDFVQHRNTWIDDGDNSEAPVHIEFQLQHQLEVANRERGVVAALVSGNKPIVIIRDRDHALGAGFCERIEKFWQDQDNNFAPEPNFERDTEMLKKIYSEAYGGVVVLSENNRAVELCEEYATGHEIEQRGAARKQAAKNELITIIDTAEKAIIGDFTVGAGIVSRKGYTVEPTTYRNIRITRKK